MKNQNDMNIIEAMKERRSVRTFDGKGLDSEQEAKLEKAIGESGSPFGGNVSIFLRKFNLREGYKPSTYGMIKGAEDFFLLGIGSDEASALSAGYRFEQVVLKAWQLGLGTCWIAATFKGSDFDKGVEWPDGEELKVICPVGKAEKQSMKEKLTRLTLGSKNRKPFNDLFFYRDFQTAVPEDNRFREALEMLRLAPSSTNSQPWRALVDGHTVHFYYKPKSAASVLDTGIGICHFHETEKFYGHEGHFDKVSSAPVAPDDWKYLVSYQRSK
ncbi:MAG: nitroreductase family protein [Muribaculaceae bacterium]|nr:nitroreductase family protein [Muribaculaceae bacterium]